MVEAFKVGVQIWVMPFKLVMLEVEACRVPVAQRFVTPTLALRLMALPEAVVLVPLARVIMGVVVEVTTPALLVTKNELVIPVKPRLVVVAEVKTEVEEFSKPEVQLFQLPPWNILWTVVVE